MTIERRKQPEAPVPSADKRTAPLDRRHMQQDLLDKIDARIKSAMMPAENRVAAAAYLLTTLKLADEAETMRLLNCGAGQMKAARKRAEESVSLGNTLGAVVRQIRLEMENPNAVPQQKAGEQETVEVRLKKFAEAAFVSDPNPASNAGKSQRRQVRMAVALIARGPLGKNPGESAKLVGDDTSYQVFRQLLTDARGEYAANGHFYKKVLAICDGIGIRAP